MLKTSSMKMTRLGISDCLLAAAIFFIALANSWFPVVILTGYVLLFESSRWLRMSAIKALAVLIAFALITAVVGLIPAGFRMLSDFFSIFTLRFEFFSAITTIFSIINTALGVVQTVLLLLLGIKAFKHETIALGQIDDLIAKHMPKEKEQTT